MTSRGSTGDGWTGHGHQRVHPYEPQASTLEGKHGPQTPANALAVAWNTGIEMASRCREVPVGLFQLMNCSPSQASSRCSESGWAVCWREQGELAQASGCCTPPCKSNNMLPVHCSLLPHLRPPLGPQFCLSTVHLLLLPPSLPPLHHVLVHWSDTGRCHVSHSMYLCPNDFT